MALFLRMALTDYDVRMYDENEGILLANRFISYLEVLRALGQLPAKIQAVMIMYYGRDMTQEKVAQMFRVSGRTIRNWITQGLDQMGLVFGQ